MQHDQIPSDHLPFLHMGESPCKDHNTLWSPHMTIAINHDFSMINPIWHGNSSQLPHNCDSVTQSIFCSSTSWIWMIKKGAGMTITIIMSPSQPRSTWLLFTHEHNVPSTSWLSSSLATHQWVSHTSSIICVNVVLSNYDNNIWSCQKLIIFSVGLF